MMPIAVLASIVLSISSINLHVQDQQRPEMIATSVVDASIVDQANKQFATSATFDKILNVSMSNSFENNTSSPKVHRVVFTRAQAGEGVIRMVTRVCEDASNWQSVAADNTIGPPVYLVKLGQELAIDCGSVTPAVQAPAAAPAVAAPAPAAPVSNGWTTPLQGICFGGGDSGFKTAGRPDHMGVDLMASWGTPIHAAAAGTVSVAYQEGKAGYYTVIDHGGVWTVYMHQSSYEVTSGWVNAGDVIGYVGSTGNSSGPHLHFEVQTDLWNRDNGYQDPMSWMSAHGVNLWC